MKIRAQIHLMPYEIDHLFLLHHQLKRSSYHLTENDKLELDVVLNLSNKLIDWNDSKLDKEFFIEKYKATQYLTDWATCRYNIYDGDEMYGHLDNTKSAIEDDIKCDGYLGIGPDIHFHETLLYYMFRSIEMIKDDYYWISPQIPKMWDSTWDCLVHEHFLDVPYEDHRKIDTYEIERVMRNSSGTQLIENDKNYKWPCWFDLHSAKLIELIGIPDSFTGYGPMDTFYSSVLELIRNPEVINIKVLDFHHYILKNQLVSDRWRCTEKRDDDPAPWNHSQDTPLRNFYLNNLVVKDTKNEQRENINKNYKNEVINVVNRLVKLYEEQNGKK